MNQRNPVLGRLLLTEEGLWATLPLRLALGLVFMAHGGQKLFGWLGGKGLMGTASYFAGKLALSPGLLWAALAGGGEFLGGLLVLLGLFTRLGALLIMAVMLVAMLKVHWGAFFLPAGIEFTLTLLCAAAALLIAGGGKFSLDALIHKKLEQVI